MPKQTGCPGRFLQRQVHNDWTVARDTFWDAFVQFSNRERQRRAEGGLHDDQGRDRGPVRLGHLHQPRDNDRQSRGDCCASRVRNPRKILLVSSP